MKNLDSTPRKLVYLGYGLIVLALFSAIIGSILFSNPLNTITAACLAIVLVVGVALTGKGGYGDGYGSVTTSSTYSKIGPNISRNYKFYFKHGVILSFLLFLVLFIVYLLS